jgi:acyl-coenzyme A thioesterase PaaI-like protein
MPSENFVLTQWNRLSGLPGGKWLFSKVVATRAPYFKTIYPLVVELRPGHARVQLKKQRAVENHIGTVHAIAVCNLLELAMGCCAEASIPPNLRWIPKGMTVEYTAKADTDLTGVAEISPEDWKPGDLRVRVTAYDTNGTVVVQGTILLWISAKKPA